MKDTSGTNQVQEQGPRNSGRTGEVVKELKAMENCKKNFTNYACFCAATMLTSKIIAEIIENHSEFYGCANFMGSGF